MNERARFLLLRDIGFGIVLLIAVLFIGALLSSGRPRSGPAPDFALVSTAGGVITPTSHPTMVLHFWMEHCGYCKRQIPRYAAYERSGGVPVYGVNIDGLDQHTPNQVRDRVGMTYTSIVDPKRQLKRAFGVSGVPTTVVLQNGQIIASEQGGIAVDELRRIVAGG